MHIYGHSMLVLYHVAVPIETAANQSDFLLIVVVVVVAAVALGVVNFVV